MWHFIQWRTHFFLFHFQCPHTLVSIGTLVTLRESHSPPSSYSSCCALGFRLQTTEEETKSVCFIITMPRDIITKMHHFCWPKPVACKFFMWVVHENKPPSSLELWEKPTPTPTHKGWNYNGGEIQVHMTSQWNWSVWKYIVHVSKGMEDHFLLWKHF